MLEEATGTRWEHTLITLEEVGFNSGGERLSLIELVLLGFWTAVG
jgi:hypothetical protein